MKIGQQFKIFRQFDSTDCGPACIRMLAWYHGKSYPLIYLRNLSSLNREGVSITGLKEGLHTIGFNAYSFKVTIKELNEYCPLPAILHWNQNHFVVLYKIRKDILTHKIQYYIADPAYGKNRLSEEDLLTGWAVNQKGVVLAAEPTPSFYRLKPIVNEYKLKKIFSKYLQPFKNELFQLALAMLVGLILSLITPFFTQALIDKGIGDRDMNLISIIVLSQLALFIGSYVIDIIRNWVVLYIGTSITVNLISDFLYKLMHLPMRFFDTKSVGDFNQRITDYYRLESFVTSDTLLTMFSTVSFIVYFIIIGIYSIPILLVYIGFSILSIWWIVMFLRKRKNMDYKLFQLNSSNQNAILETINGMNEIKLNNLQEYKCKEWQKIQQKLYNTRIKFLKINQTQSTGFMLINQLRSIFVTFIVATSVVKGEITLGMMISISYIIGQMNSPLVQMIGFIQNVQDSRISLERSGEIHIQENEDCKPYYREIFNQGHEIVLKNVSFRYSGMISGYVLQNLNLIIPARKTTAIVGESGSGKTTLIKLLLKFYTPTKGTIFIGEYSLEDYSSTQWRDKCGVVMQDNYLFSDTIRRNIILKDEMADEKRLTRAIKIANLEKFIAEKASGLETMIGTAGIGISGGERQRLMIARTVYKNPEYLFLDEATSSLDAENERMIVNNLSDFFKNKTVIISAHRLSTVRNADQILVLKEGKIAEIGRHEELILRKGTYFNLIKNQLELAKT